MKKLVLIVVFLLSFSVMVMAQDTPAVEIFGGYSYVRINPSPGMKADVFNTNGWDASIAFNANKFAGVVADFGGNYGTMMHTNIVSWADVRIHSIMFGPKVTLGRGKVSPFLQALIGNAHYTSKELGRTATNNSVAVALGGGVDVSLNKTIAVRPVQLEYLGIRDGLTGNFNKNFRYSAGFVLKLGNHK